VTDLSFWERLRVAPQYLLPHHLLSAGMRRLTRCAWRPLKNLLIRAFIRRFQVDMQLAREPDYRRYQTFNDFFTRELRRGARPPAGDAGDVLCPVDGSISRIGEIQGSELVQVKGRTYSLSGLLAGDEPLAAKFQNGAFTALYLSPRDYHRVHMPVSGQLLRMIYVPGRLFSVNAVSVRNLPGLFARNERVISVFQTSAGLMAVILVGALFVGGMETVWAGPITPASTRRLRRWDYPEPDRVVRLDRGAEMGRFNMGSTVILLFEPGRVQWLEQLNSADPVVMGQALGKIVSEVRPVG
jgi:phosphatidylserine decarboxylase